MIAGISTGAYDDVRTGTNRTRRRGVIALAFATVALLLTLLAPLTSPAGAEWSPPSRVYIEQTGHTLDQVFLDVWRDSGKEASYGYPVTPEITLDNGHIVQYLQYARFEYWPEGDAEGRYFHIGNIGEELRPISLPRSIAAWNSTGEPKQSARSEESLRMAQAWLPVTNSAIEFSSRFVAETRHTVSGEFRDFWELTGEASYLGNPLTEEYESGGVIHQVFERGQLQIAPGEGARMVPVGLLLAEKYGLDQSPVAQGDIPTYDEALFVAPPP